MSLLQDYKRMDKPSSFDRGNHVRYMVILMMLVLQDRMHLVDTYHHIHILHH